MKILLSPLGKERWEVMSDFHVYSKVVKERITVHKGFITDLASVPRIFWRILPPFGKYSTPAVVHDYLYKTKKYQRKTCDLIFQDLMQKFKVSKWKIKIMYLAVRIFGKMHFGVNNP